MSLVDNILSEIENVLQDLDDETVSEIESEKLTKLRQDINPYGRTIEGSDNYLTFSYTNLKENYNNKLNTTAMIGFLNRLCDEWHVPDGIPVIPVYDFVKDPNSIHDFYKNWVLDDKMKKQIKENEEWMYKRVVVKEFLEEMFQYNPDEHVRSSYKPQPKDKDRKIIDTPAANLAIQKLKKKDLKFREQMLQFDRVSKLSNMATSVHSDEKDTKLSNPSLNEFQNTKLVLPGYHYSLMDFKSWSDEDKNCLRRVCEMIPPEDTFHRFKHYLESNYDKLREAVLYLYCDKPEFDIAFNPYSWHKTEEEAENFQKKHKNEVIADIYKAHSGKWNFVAPFEKVRQSMKYFNENTIVLEEIANQIERDAKIGHELMKNRIRKQKRKNIAEEGPDAEAFAKWKAQNKTLESMGAEHVNQESYADDECPDDGVQIDVFRISKGGLELKKDKFYSKAVAPVIGDEKEN
jgi:hypothetical protein